MDAEAANFFLHNVIDISNEPLMIISASLQVVAINQAATQIVGASVAPLVGKRLEAVLYQNHPPKNDLNISLYEQFFKNPQPFTYVRSQFNQGGLKVTVQVSGRPITSATGEVFLCESMYVLLDSKQLKANTPKKALIGQSPAYQSMLKQLDKAARCDIPTLLCGETGTGKEVAAHYLHQMSARSSKPFVIADCTVLSEALFESELFGHEKGSFTGSVGDKKGLFEVANGGTLFLDEIGEMSLSLQVKLLRVLESYTFRRVGGTEYLNANVRIVCATNRDLLQMVKAGTFRQDLYYRLAVFQVMIPSLQERREDIPSLAQGLLAQINAAIGRNLEITEAALAAICRLPLPGNIRELRNVMQYAAASSNGSQIEVEDLPPTTAGPAQQRFSDQLPATYDRRATDHQPVLHNRRATDKPSAIPFKPTHAEPALSDSAFPEDLPDGIVNTVEMQYLAKLIKRYDGNKNQVAKHMGISQRTLYRKLAYMGEGLRKFLDSES